PIPNAVVTYNSSFPGVATVSSTGLVTTVALGTAFITVQSESVSVLDTVRVVDSSIVGSPALSGSPFGIAADGAGAVYVTRHDANALTRFTLPGTAAVALIAVGMNPASVAFDSAGTTAYVTDISSNEVQVI